jgi:proton-coupled amino acid transporter
MGNRYQIFLNFVIAIACVFIIMPLVLVRDVSSLGSLMIFATLCTFWTILAVIAFSGIQINMDGVNPGVSWLIKPDSCIIFLGMSAFLYGKIGIIVPIRDIMKEKHLFKPCLALSLWTVCGIFSVFGLVPYLAYGLNKNVKEGGGMITLALNQGNIIVQATELSFMAALIPSFVLMMYVPIKIWEKALYGDWPRSWKRTWLKNLWRLLAVIAISYLAVSTGKTFDKVMALFGSLFGGPLTFIWPAVFHLILTAETKAERIQDYFLITFGALSSSFTLYLALKKLFGS